MKRFKVISVVGTRPNFVKVAPICRAFTQYADQIEFLLCHTGQHSDAGMSGVFFQELGMSVPDFFLGINNGSHAEITGKIMIEFEKILIDVRPNLVLVVGDVNSTMACALAAVKLGIRVAHVEAGLRSGDRSMPEEINRIVTDSISDYLFVTEQSGMSNLSREGVNPSNIFFTGNVMIDTMVYLENQISGSDILKTMGLKAGGYALMTFHRPSNVDERVNLQLLITFLNEMSAEIPVVFPVHPRTMKNINLFGLSETLAPYVMLTNPLGYIDFQALTKYARVVVTDSGGIQEETTFLGIQCLTVRENTERPVTIEVGTNQLCGTDFAVVKEKIVQILSGNVQKGAIPYLWDGNAAKRIVEILAKLIINY